MKKQTVVDKYEGKVGFSSEKPPVFDQCQELFGIDWASTIFAYTPNIHAEDPKTLDDDIVEHEMVHIERQNGDAQLWWERYLTDPQFRLEEELVAYRRQYFYLRDNKKIDRNDLDKKVRAWSLNLSGRGYGFLTDYQTAYYKITH